VTDGRSSGYSIGIGLEELAELLISMGAEQAINLDGGQSSLMVGGDGYLSFPANGKERWVDNAIAITSKPPS
jgi:exopolysaccharide biosynthesis protein